MVAIVERHVDLAVSDAGEEQTLAVAGSSRTTLIGAPPGSPVHDLRPRRAAVVRAVDVRAHVVEAKRVDRRVGRVIVEAAGVHNGHLGIHGTQLSGGVTSVQVSPPPSLVV